MGNREPDTDFEAAKHRIDSALDTLRTELRELQNQDLSLLKQLLHIQHNIDALSGRRDIYRRSYSSSSLAPQWDCNPPLLLSPVHKSSSSGHLLLSRVHSEPMSEAVEEGDTLIPGDEEEWLSQSFGGSSTKFSKHENEDDNLESEMTDLLSPLPVAHGRRRALSSTDTTCRQQSPTPTSSSQTLVPSWNGAHPIFTPPQYSLSYETLLKRSTEAWKSVQMDKEENGIVDKKKMATLKMFL